MFRQGLKLARKIAQTKPLSDVLLQEVTPGPDTNTDKEWEQFAANTIGTEYHPANTLAMLPKDIGGVVDAKLRVYGMSNVRVADASVFPIQFAAHVSFIYPEHVEIPLMLNELVAMACLWSCRTSFDDHPRLLQRCACTW